MGLIFSRKVNFSKYIIKNLQKNRPLPNKLSGDHIWINIRASDMEISDRKRVMLWPVSSAAKYSTEISSTHKMPFNVTPRHFFNKNNLTDINFISH
jgi:hypothetical protein